MFYMIKFFNGSCSVQMFICDNYCLNIHIFKRKIHLIVQYWFVSACLNINFYPSHLMNINNQFSFRYIRFTHLFWHMVALFPQASCNALALLTCILRSWKFFKKVSVSHYIENCLKLIEMVKIFVLLWHTLLVAQRARAETQAYLS